MFRNQLLLILHGRSRSRPKGRLGGWVLDVDQPTTRALGKDPALLAVQSPWVAMGSAGELPAGQRHGSGSGRRCSRLVRTVAKRDHLTALLHQQQAPVPTCRHLDHATVLC